MTCCGRCACIVVLVITCSLSLSYLHRCCIVEMGQGGPGNSPAPSGMGGSLPVWRGGADCSLRTYVHISRVGSMVVGFRVSCFWFLHMRRLEEVVMTSLRTREGLSPEVSADASSPVTLSKCSNDWLTTFPHLSSPRCGVGLFLRGTWMRCLEFRMKFMSCSKQALSFWTRGCVVYVVSPEYVPVSV